MANPVDFEGANAILYAPLDNNKMRTDLPIFRNDDQTISCWRLTKEELRRVNETGIIWCSCEGNILPPIFITGEDFLFIEGRPAKADPYIPPPPKR